MWPEPARPESRAARTGVGPAGGSCGHGPGHAGARRRAAIHRQSSVQTITSTTPAQPACSPRPLRHSRSQSVARSPLPWWRLRPDPDAPRDRGPGSTVLDPIQQRLTKGKRAAPPVLRFHLSWRPARGGFSLAYEAAGLPSRMICAIRPPSRICLPFVNLYCASWISKMVATVRELVEHALAKLQRCRVGPAVLAPRAQRLRSSGRLRPGP